ncbi:MAG TPA: hypothetical protein VM287_04705 [Egibacteraceae bacterium]|jgi:hypothetical protein|nr:hypothetical protein [Egibacteraceae bacterium]
MAVTQAQNTAANRSRPNKTRLDTDTHKPAVTAPGDAPFDTTDPQERASTVIAIPGPEALAEGTVNGVVPLPVVVVEQPEVEPRVETYEQRRPDGKLVTVTHNLETGETSVGGADTAGKPKPTK